MKTNFNFLVGLAFLLSLEVNLKAADDQGNTFKDFLKSRPPIYKIVFLSTEFTNGSPTTSCLYEGGWNKEDFYLKRYAAPGSPDANFRINLVTNLQSFWGVGKQGNTYWHITDSNDLTRTELQPQVSPESNAISAHALNLKLILDRTLNLGIELLKIGTVKWDGDNVVAEYEDGIVKIKKVTYHVHGQTLIIDHPRIYGQIIRENGQISGLTISDDCTNFGASYQLVYKYDPNNSLPRHFPNSIIRSRIIGRFGSSQPVEAIDVISVEFSSTNIPTIAYTLSNYIGSTNSYSVLFSNNQYYTFSSNHTPQLLNFVNYKASSGPETKIRRIIVIASMVLTSAVLFSLIFVLSKSQTTDNKKAKNER